MDKKMLDRINELAKKKNAIAPKITDSGATTIQQQINDTFSSTASEAISKMVSEAAKKIKGDVDDTNETIINDISLVHKNIEEYNKVLKNFKKTAKSSEKIIDDTIDILNEVNKVADSTVGNLVVEKLLTTAGSDTWLQDWLYSFKLWIWCDGD